MFTVNRNFVFNAIRVVLLACFLMLQNLPMAQAQCPMCKASVESNLANGETKGAGLNKGIMFLLIIPYLAAGSIAFVYYRNYKLRKKRQESLVQA